MERVTLVTVHNAFDRTGRDTRRIQSGLTLAEMQTLFLPASVDFALSVNGRTVTDLTTVPRGGDMVTAVPVLTGGNDGKMIGRLIGMIVLTIIATVAQQHWATAVIWGMNAGYLAAGAIMIVGGLLLNMALGANTPNGGGLQTYGDNANNSPSYGWSPQSTQQQGTVIPRWYGKNKLFGNIIVGHIAYVGDKSYINALINLGFGPFNGLSDFMVNDQPVANFTGVQTPDVRLGNLNQPVCNDFNDTTVEYNTSQLAAYGAPAIYTTQGNEFDTLEILIQFPRGLGYYNDQGAMVALSVNYDVSISPHGMNTWQSMGTGVVATEVLTGWYIGQWVRDGVQNVWLKYEAVIPAWANFYEDNYGKTIIENGIAFRDNGTGNGVITVYDIDQINSYIIPSSMDAVVGAIWQWFNGENVPVADGTAYLGGLTSGMTATGAQSNPIRINKSYRVGAKGYYDIKAERLSADFTDTRHIGELYLASVREVTGQSFTYPRQVLVGLKALATNQLSGSLRFSCMAECSIIRVWNGTTWSNAYSTNPAWICYDVLTQPVIPDAVTAPVRYDGIDPARIDHVKFKEWADYCDELLPDGNGGTEKRIEFNGGFDSEMSLWEAVLRICTVAYAAPVWNGIRLSVTIDKPADPVQLFSLGNIDQDSFKENFLPMEDRAAEIEVDFVNQENNYQRDKLTVVNDEMTTVTSKVNISMFGVTKPSMCWRAAMRKLAYNQHIGRTVDFGADIDAIACTVGDVILVQHDVPQWGYGGRVVSATTTAVTIDQTIALAPGVQYAILVRMGDDSLVERDITNAAGDATVLTVSPAFGTAPAQFDVFTVGEILKTAKPFRVSNITRDSDIKAKISAIEYVAGIYNVDYDIPVTGALDYTQPLTSYKQSLPPFQSVTGLTVNESLRKYNSGQVASIASIYWTPVLNRYAFPTVEVWAWQDGTAPQKISNNPISADSFEWALPVDGVYWNFAVACVNLNGESQPLNGLVPFRKFIFGKTAAPADVTDFYAVPVNTGGIRFDWSPVADLDIYEYLIRHSPLTSGADWYGASELTRTSANYANLNIAQTGTYFIKAVDTTGHESVAADSVVISTVPSAIGLTPHTLIEEHPAWAGAKTNLTLTAGELDVTGGSLGTYVVGTSINFGALKTARVAARCDWRVLALGGDFDAITDLDAVLDLDNPTGKSNVQAYIYTSQTSAAPTFKQPLFAGDYTFWRASFGLEATETQPDQLTIHSLDINVDIHDTVITL